MLQFLRKYQRYFYLIITVVIIISFSFFGTYSTLGGDNYRDQIAFTAIDGTPVTRGELDRLVMFISTDARDKLVFGGIWGPNFLNDGVIRKDLFANGLSEHLSAQYSNEFAEDLDRRLEKEKHFSLYTHPQVPIVGLESAWNSFAPQITKQYRALKEQQSASTPEAFDARVQLYLVQDSLPAPAVRQLLLYQQRQYNLQPDPNLDHTDLSLFGYHTLDDWFGPRFLRVAAEFIINSAKIAQQRGYKVSKEEALADLMHNSELSYRDNRENPNLGVANSQEYFNDQLQRLSLDQNKAAQVWQQVLLFRRLFHDVGQAVFVDPQSVQPFSSFANTTVEGDLYRLPPEFRFNNVRSLELFEAYLKAISPEGKAGLNLPKSFLATKEILEKSPELIQKRYLIDISQANKNLLQARVSVKETWNWEADEKNWAMLQGKFPELLKGTTREERLAILDGIDEQKRTEIDNFARLAIVNTHPEWLEKALQDAEPKRKTVTLNFNSTQTPFAGLKKSGDMIALLDHAKLGEQDPALAQYSADGQTYYKIVVIDRSAQPEVATFAEAVKAGVLQGFPKSETAPLFKEIYEAYATGIAPEKAPATLIDDVSASLRLFSYTQEGLTQLKKNPENSPKWVQAEAEKENDPNHLPIREPLANQWKLIKTAHSEERSGESGDLNLQSLFTMKPGSWSRLQTPVTGDLYFFQLKKKGSDASIATLDNQVMVTHKLLAEEVQNQLMLQLLDEIRAKKAISLEYLNLKEEKVEES